MRRHYLDVAGATFFLAQGHDIQQAKDAVVAAIRAGGGLVDLVVFGNVEVSVAVSPGVPVVFRSENVDADDRDTGDVSDPFHPIESIETLGFLL
jgi:hypothetical protein